MQPVCWRLGRLLFCVVLCLTLFLDAGLAAAQTRPLSAGPVQASPATSSTASVALSGAIVLPQSVLEHGTVLVQNGRISAVGADLKLPAGTRVVATGGIIAPGLIDLHNHMTYNIFPRWKPIEQFGNRYDWQQRPVYKILIEVPHRGLVEEGLECEMERYAEVKTITEGETSVAGTTHANCALGLVRELDVNPHLPETAGKIVYNVFPLQMTEPELADAAAALSSQPRGAVLIHLGEGAPHDPAAQREFTMLKGRGLLRPGVTLIHAVAVTPDGFAQMAKNGVGFVWSPRSNIELYGDTANVAAAKAAGVTIALAPDWSPTGSDGLLSELNYASLWNQTQSPPVFTEKDLVDMATSGAATLAGLGSQTGAIAPGYAADLLVVRRNQPDAYASLTHAGPQDVELVMIGGKPVYGDDPVMQQLGGKQLNGKQPGEKQGAGKQSAGSLGERMEVCQANKILIVEGQAFSQTEKTLDRALHQFGRKLAPLSECGY